MLDVLQILRMLNVPAHIVTTVLQINIINMMIRQSD